MRTLIFILFAIFSFQGMAMDLYFEDSDDQSKMEFAGKIVEVSRYGALTGLIQNTLEPNPWRILAVSGKSCLVPPSVGEKSGYTFEDMKTLVEYDENGRFADKSKFYLVCIPFKKDNRFAISIGVFEY